MTSAHDTDATVAAFISELTGAVTPLDRGWVAAFENVPRGVFVPYFFQQGPPDWRWRIVEPPDPEWAKAIYSRRPLGTQIDGDDSLAEAARREPVHGILTSSSSAPTLMAQMLQALDVRDCDRVLEIGTGTGYLRVPPHLPAFCDEDRPRRPDVSAMHGMAGSHRRHGYVGH